MERTLIIIRHAKSSWADPGQDDFDRPLNDRGREDAPVMGARLKQRGLLPDIILCSDAKRTRQTAKRMAEALGISKDNIETQHELYLASPEQIENTLTKVGSNHKIVYLIAHNPGITEFVNEVSDRFRIDNVPTCGMVGIRFSAASWADYSRSEREIIFFDYPKNPHVIK